MSEVKRGDWVTAKRVVTVNGIPRVHVGLVRRVARDGSWCDVRWRAGGHEWTKRMPTSALVVEHTIPIPGGTVTDVTRKEELE